MWKLKDEVLNEVREFQNYEEAKDFAKGRLWYHSSEFLDFYDGLHKSIDCELIEDKTNKTLIIKRK